MAEFFTGVGLLAFFAGLFGMVSPRLLRLPRRLHAAAIAGGGLALMLIAVPEPESSRASDEPASPNAAAAEWQQELERRQAAIERTREDGQTAQQPTPSPPSATTTTTDWQMINFVNEFGERTDQGTVSRTVSPRRAMSFPYGATTGRIFVDCDRAWVRFSETPNLTGGDIGDGYTRYTVTVRVDGNNARCRMSQSWGEDDLRFVDPSRAIGVLSGGSTFDLALPWYGEGSVVFSWSLTGSSDAIQRSCD